MHVGVRGADRAIAVCDHLRGRAADRCSPSAPTRRSSIGVDTGLHSASGPRSSPGPSRAAGSTSRSATGPPTPTSSSLLERDELDRRVDPAVVERPPASPLRHRRGADLRRAEPRRGVVPAGGADDGLRRPGRARLRRRARSPAAAGGREVEENLWRAIRYGMDGRMIDFAAGREIEARAARRARCSSGPRRPARRSAIDAEPQRPERRPARPRGARRGPLDRRGLPRDRRRDRPHLRARAGVAG